MLDRSAGPSCSLLRIYDSERSKDVSVWGVFFFFNAHNLAKGVRRRVPVGSKRLRWGSEKSWLSACNALWRDVE